MNLKYQSRKFVLAAFFALSSTVALFTEVMTDVLYVSVVGTIMAIYGASNVMGKKHNVGEGS